MLQVNLTNLDGSAAENSVAVSPKNFDAAFNQSLVHQVVTAYLAGARSGTKANKSRSQVSGGGRKPWRQKGTGNARAGTIRSPIWRSGGVTFAAQPRNYAQKVNRKMYRGALRCVLSELVRSQRLVVVEDFNVEAPKTKQVVAQLGALKLDDVLIVVSEIDEQLDLAVRNLHWAALIDINDVTPVNLMAFDKVLMTSKVLNLLEERLK